MVTPGSTSPSALRSIPHAGAGIIGVARRDITPPVGIYARMWGAAKHDVSEGTHKPLMVSAVTIRQSPKDEPLVLVGMDLALLGDLGNDSDEQRMMKQVSKVLGINRRSMIINCSHTHASPWSATSRLGQAGGEMIPAYLDQVANALCESVREALATQAPAVITWATGKCDLAINRDLKDPDASKDRFVCGYNPSVVADDTMLVGRITRDSDGKCIGTIVNYACHPTTLAWLNRVISPDFIGAMRETVEEHFPGPCMYLQGASGELAPAHQYVGDTAIPDRHGRRLGYAALSALESMEPHRQCLGYKGVQESGAPLAVWWPEPFEPDNTVKGIGFDIPLPIRPMPTLAQLQAEHDDPKTDRVMRERLFRKMQIVKSLDASGFRQTPAWVFRIGKALIIAHPNEAYSCFQKDLRAAFPDYAVIVMNVSGAEIGYICPPELYKTNIYQVWQTPFGEKALGVLTEHCKDKASQLAK
jgi:hypothetical protein